MATFTAATATASTQQTGYEATKAIDGYSGATRWASAGGAGAGSWLQRDEGTAKVATWYQVNPGDYNAAQDPASWTFQGSNNGSSWTTLDTRASQLFTNRAALTYQIANGTAYRYYRLSISATNGDGTCSVSEFEVGDGVAPSWLDARAGASSTVSGTFTIGRDFTVARAGYITHLEYPCNGSGSGTVTLRLYQGTTVLATITDDRASRPALGPTRVAVLLSTPIAVSPSTTYRVAAYCPGSAWSTAGSVSTDSVSGDVTALANGAWYSELDERPTTAGSSRYGVGVVYTETLQPTYSTTVLADAPLGYWRLGATSGTAVADSSGSARTLTSTSAPTWSQGSLVPSSADTAANITTAAQAASRTPEAWMWVSGRSYTVEAWIKTTSTGVILSMYNVAAATGSVAHNFIFGVSDNAVYGVPTGRLFFWADYTAGVVSAQSTVVVNDGLVHHVAAVVDQVAKTIYIYVDGAISGSTPFSGVTLTGGINTSGTTNPLVLGAAINNATINFTPFNGTLDEVALYGTALSPNRVAAHTLAGLNSSAQVEAVYLEVLAVGHTAQVEATYLEVLAVGHTAQVEATYLEVLATREAGAGNVAAVGSFRDAPTIATSWVPFTNQDVVIAASVGDVIEVGTAFVWNTGSTSYRYADVAVIVNEVITRWVSTGTGSHTDGIQGLALTNQNSLGNSSGSLLYTVQSGDLVGGKLRLRPYGKATSNRILLPSEPHALWAAPAPGGVVAAASGSPSTSWAQMGTDITIPAAAGDVIEIGASAALTAGTPTYRADVATIVSGSPLNYLSSQSTTQATEGLSGWQGTGISVGFSGSSLYTVQAGDVVAGNVTFRLLVKQSAGTSRTVTTDSVWFARKVTTSAAIVRRTSPDFPVLTPAMIDLDSSGAFDLSVAASPGDWLEIGISAVTGPNTSRATIVDARPLASGRSIGTFFSSDVDYIAAFSHPSINTGGMPLRGSTLYQVQADDISGGVVTLRISARTNTNTHSILSSSDAPAAWHVVNRVQAPVGPSAPWSAALGSLPVTVAVGGVEVVPSLG